MNSDAFNEKIFHGFALPNKHVRSVQSLPLNQLLPRALAPIGPPTYYGCSPERWKRSYDYP